MAEKLAEDQAKKYMISWSQIETILKDKDVNPSVIVLVHDAFNEIGNGATTVSVEQVYLSLGKIEKALEDVPPKQILEWIVVVVIEDITITWPEVEVVLTATLANPIEVKLVKTAFDYLSGGSDSVKVGAIVKKIKGLFAQL